MLLERKPKRARKIEVTITPTTSQCGERRETDIPPFRTRILPFKRLQRRGARVIVLRFPSRFVLPRPVYLFSPHLRFRIRCGSERKRPRPPFYIASRTSERRDRSHCQLSLQYIYIHHSAPRAFSGWWRALAPVGELIEDKESFLWVKFQFSIERKPRKRTLASTQRPKRSIYQRVAIMKEVSGNCASMGMEVRSWTKLNPQGDAYSPRTGHTVTCNDGRVYVFGGTDRRRRQQDLFQFDIETSSWSQVQTRGALPPRRSGALGVVDANKMFIFGGYDGRDGNYFNDLFYFNFESQRWDEMPSIVGDRPEARTDHIMVLHSSCIYIFGGYNGSCRFNDLCEYSVEKKRWLRIEANGSIPSRRFGHSGVVHTASNRLIVFGGWDGRDTLNDLFEFNFVTNEWRKMETRGTSPPHRYRHTAVIFGDNMFVFGGVDKTHSRFNDLQRLDLLTNTWSEVCTTGSIPSSRTFHRAVVVGSKMYLLGGYDGTDRLQDLYAIDVGALSPPSLVDICSEYIRRNTDAILDVTTFKGVPSDVLDHVIFKRDGESHLRGKCKVCRSGRCCVYRARKDDTPDTENSPPANRDKNDTNQKKEYVCLCGHSNYHHELIDESKLYGKKPVDSTSTKVLMLCGSIYKRLFDTNSSSSSYLLGSPTSRFSEDSSISGKECTT